jgi:apolipoprotein N-acyltransferase
MSYLLSNTTFSVLLFMLSGSLVGFVSWGGNSCILSLIFILLLPLLWSYAPSRMSAAMMMFGYYLAGSRGLPLGTAAFFGNSAPACLGWLFWSAACFMLTLPYLVLWSSRQSSKSWAYVLAVLITLIPPIGLIGWVNPISVSGLAYPSLGWYGLVLMIMLTASIINRSIRWTAFFVLIALSTNLYSVLYPITQPSGWAAVDTRFSGLAGGAGDDAGQVLAAIRRIAWLKSYAASIPPNSVRTLPEMVLGSYSDDVKYTLTSVDEALAKKGSRLLIGAGIPEADGRYWNSVVILGSRERDSTFATQSIPVPFAMWKPWALDGARADILGDRGLAVIKGLRVGVLICYEELLPFSYLKLLANHPSVLIGAANSWWVRDPSIPNIQKQMMSVYARLFGASVFSAFNY